MSKAAGLIRAQVAEITLLKQRIVFLEREAMILQEAVKRRDELLTTLRHEHADLQRRHDLIMARSPA